MLRRKAGDLLAEVEEMNGHAPPLDEPAEEQETTACLTMNNLTQYQAAMVKVLQWVEGGAAPRPTGEDMRLAMWGLNQTRAGKKSPGCFEWIAKRMDIDRSTLHRLISTSGPPGVPTPYTPYILSLQALILSDWIRREGYEPLAIFSKDTDTALARTLREKVKGYVPPEEVKAGLETLPAEELKTLWRQMANSFAEVLWDQDEDQRRIHEFNRLTNYLCTAIITEEDSKASDANRFRAQCTFLVSSMKESRALREAANG